MKNLLVVVLCLLSTLSFSQQFASPSLGIYTEYVRVSEYEYEVGKFKKTLAYPGIELDFKHGLREISWIGTNFGLRLDGELQLPVFYIGITLRQKFFRDFIEGSLILPRMTMPLDNWGATGYNTPYGVGVRIFKGKIRVRSQTMFYKNGVSTRIGVFYRFQKRNRV